MLDSSLNDQISCQPKELLPRDSIEVCHAKLHQFSKSDHGTSSAVHPMRTLEDENLDNDSNASSSSFEFHKREMGTTTDAENGSFISVKQGDEARVFDSVIHGKKVHHRRTFL